MRRQVSDALNEQVLYHATKTPLMAGQILEPLNCPKKWGFPEHIEAFIDGFRPEGGSTSYLCDVQHA